MTMAVTYTLCVDEWGRALAGVDLVLCVEGTKILFRHMRREVPKGSTCTITVFGVGEKHPGVCTHPASHEIPVTLLRGDGNSFTRCLRWIVGLYNPLYPLLRNSGLESGELLPSAERVLSKLLDAEGPGVWTVRICVRDIKIAKRERKKK